MPPYLTCNPFGRRICCDVDPDEVSAVEPDDDEGIEQVETDRWNNEQASGPSQELADFIYAGGAVAAHGVVLAEAHGSFALAVTRADMKREAKQKYFRQVKPHIGQLCAHGKVVHGYSLAFGSNPVSSDTFLHIAETEIAKKKSKRAPPPAVSQAGAGSAPASVVFASHRSNFLLMGAPQIVAWIDWLRGAGNRPDDEIVTTFLTFGLGDRRFWVVAESLFPFVRPWLLLHEFESIASRLPPSEYDHWFRWLQGSFVNVFAMEEVAAKSFLSLLSGMTGAQAAPLPRAFDLPAIEPFGLVPGFDSPSRDDGSRYPFVLFRDGLAFLSRLITRTSAPDRFTWSPRYGFG